MTVLCVACLACLACDARATTWLPRAIWIGPCRAGRTLADRRTGFVLRSVSRSSKRQHAGSGPLLLQPENVIGPTVIDQPGGEMAQRRIRVLCVEGDGKRSSWSSDDWLGSEFGIGLQRGLGPELISQLDVHFSSHTHVFDSRGTLAPRPDRPDGPFRRPAMFTQCDCCRPGLRHLFYEGLHNQLPEWVRNAGYRAFVFLFLKDVRLFTGDITVREAAIAQVLADLDRVRPHVVLAHSLGAVIAVEALAKSDWANAPQLLVTAGAPFSWPRFMDTWSPAAAAWLEAKRCDWWNFVDLSDEVTANRVPPETPHVAARHVVVNNDHFAPNSPEADGRHTSNHRARDYLRHPKLSEAIEAVGQVALA